MADDIVQKIKIQAEGGDAASAEFKKVGDAAEKSAEQVKKVGEGGGEGFSKTTTGATEASDAITKLGTEAGRAVDTLAGSAQKLGSIWEGSTSGISQLKQEFQTLEPVVAQTDAALAKLGEEGTKVAAEGITQVADASQDVVAKVTDAGNAVETTLVAFGKIGSVLQDASDAIAALGPAGKIAAEGLNLIGKVLQGAHAALTVVAPAIDKTITAIEQLGPKGRAAADGLRSVITRMIEAAEAAGQSAGVFGRLAGAIGAGFAEALALATAALGPFGIALIAIGVAIAAVTTAVIYFGNASLEAARKLRELSEVTGQTGTQIQQGEAAFRRMGIETEKYGEIARNVSQTIADLGPTISKTMDAAANSLESATQSALKAEQAGLRAKLAASGPLIVGQDIGQRYVDSRRLLEVTRILNSEEHKAAQAREASEQAQRRAREEQANNMLTLLPLMKRVAEGAKDIKFDGLTTSTSKVEAAGLALKRLSDEGKDAIGGLINMVQNLSRTSDALAVGKAFGFTEEDVFRLRRYGQSWGELRQQIAATGKVPISEADAENLAQAQQGVTHLTNAWHRLQDALQAPLFGSALGEADSGIDELAAKILDFISDALEGFLKFTNNIGTYFSTLPDAVDASLSQIKELWFSAWAAMAEAMADVFSHIPTLGGASAELKAWAASWRETAGQAAADGEASQKKIQAAFAETEQVVRRSGQQQVTSAEQSAQASEKAAQSILTWDQAVRDAGGDTQKAAENVAKLNVEGSKVAQSTQGILTWGQAVDKFGGDVQKAAEYVNQLGKQGEQAGQQVADGLKQTAPAVEEVKDKIAEPPDFSSVTEAAETAKQKIAETFSTIDLSGLSSLTADFSGVVDSAQTTADQIKQSFTDIGAANFAPLVDSATQAFDLITQQVATTAEGITSAFEAIDYSGLITQLDNVVTAFENMETAAYAAAKAAHAAAEASAEANGGGGSSGSFGFGGLFRGHPGTDTNLAWLSDYEFVMRREAVQKYGVSFMQLINAGRFASGGLVGGGGGSAIDVNVDAPPDVASAMLSAVQGIGALFNDLGRSIYEALQGVSQQLIDGVKRTQESLGDVALSIVEGLSKLGEGLKESVNKAQQSMIDMVFAMSTTLWKSAFEAGAEAFKKKLEDATEKGSGGLFRGRPGRDTNLAWLTDMEFVMRPEAVAKYGVNFMHLINALQFPFDGFRNGGLVMPQINIPAFRAGGINAYAGGGMVGRPLTLVLDGQSFPNLSGPAAVVDGLEKHATLKRAARVGRAPSWVK